MLQYCKTNLKGRNKKLKGKKKKKRYLPWKFAIQPYCILPCFYKKKNGFPTTNGRSGTSIKKICERELKV